MPKRKQTKGQEMIYKAITENKDPATPTSLKTGNELRCSGKLSSYCSTCEARRVTPVTIPVIGLWLRQAEYDRGHLW